MIWQQPSGEQYQPKQDRLQGFSNMLPMIQQAMLVEQKLAKQKRDEEIMKSLGVDIPEREKQGKLGRAMEGLGQFLTGGSGMDGMSELEKTMVEAQIKAKAQQPEIYRKRTEKYEDLAAGEGWDINLSPSLSPQKKADTARKLYASKKAQAPKKGPLTEGKIDSTLGELESGGASTIYGEVIEFPDRQSAVNHVLRKLGPDWKDLAPKANEIINRKWPGADDGSDEREQAKQILINKGYSEQEAEEMLGP